MNKNDSCPPNRPYAPTRPEQEIALPRMRDLGGPSIPIGCTREEYDDTISDVSIRLSDFLDLARTVAQFVAANGIIIRDTDDAYVNISRRSVHYETWEVNPEYEVELARWKELMAKFDDDMKQYQRELEEWNRQRDKSVSDKAKRLLDEIRSSIKA